MFLKQGVSHVPATSSERSIPRASPVAAGCTWLAAAVMLDHSPEPAEAERRVRSKLKLCLREAILAR